MALRALRARSADPGDTRLIDTTQWERRRAHVLNDLRLDPRNVRLGLAEEVSQAEIRQELFAEHRAYELLKAIVEVGYFTQETPVAVRDDEIFVVVEGNRRLAALQAICSPPTVPAYESRIRRLTAGLGNDRRDALETIEILVAPDREEADELIAALHTSNPRQPWTPVRQAAFFRDRLRVGRTLDELVRRYPTIDVKSFVLGARVMEAFEAVDYVDPALREFVRSRRWQRSYSTLERLFQSRAFLEVTGLRLGDTGGLELRVSKAAWERMAEHIVAGISSNRLNTRTLNETGAGAQGRFAELIAELESMRGRRRAKHQPLVTPPAGGEAEPARGAEQAPPPEPAPRRPRRSSPRYLDIPSVPAGFPSGMRALYEELGRIDVNQFPNLTAFGLRALLERTIKAFAEVKSEKIPAKRGQVSLDDCLRWLEKRLDEEGDTTRRQAAGKLRTSRLATLRSDDPVVGADLLNAASHNHTIAFEPDEARRAWDSMQPIVAYMVGP
ncbi:hypothetical protein [Miltoncostaea marina]|uniref:hypothetical protein n=1 Tax=Miltoncostaea marina TaxID=2843215 RepID=UPI001C3E4905|nr:hypothetical protein [Miltoncostaea marina]